MRKELTGSQRQALEVLVAHENKGGVPSHRATYVDPWGNPCVNTQVAENLVKQGLALRVYDKYACRYHPTPEGRAVVVVGQGLNIE